MKQIKLNHITKPVKKSHFTKDRFYIVALGNGFNSSFRSERLARAFLNETNKELNLKMFELNFLYSDIYRLYRSAWLYLDKNRFSGLNNMEVLITEGMNKIENSFNLLVDRAAWGNGNYLVFSHFRAIINEINYICGLLKKVFKKRGLTASCYELDSYSLRAGYILTAVEIWPNKIKQVGEKIAAEKIIYLKAV